MTYGLVLDHKQLDAPPLPPRRGPVTEALFDVLERDAERARVVLPPMSEAHDDPLYGDDSALALYCLYELHYRGFEAVDVNWEWNPSLLAWRALLEREVLQRLRDEVGEIPA